MFLLIETNRVGNGRICRCRSWYAFHNSDQRARAVVARTAIVIGAVYDGCTQVDRRIVVAPVIMKTERIR